MEVLLFLLTLLFFNVLVLHFREPSAGPTEIKFKKMDPVAVLPSRAYPGDAGLDLTAVSVSIDEDKVTYDFGLAVEIPAGYVGLIFPRSSIKYMDLAMTNCVGVIDSGCREPLSATFRILKDFPQIYSAGARIAQLVVMPVSLLKPQWADTLSDTARAGGGFGSSGR